MSEGIRATPGLQRLFDKAIPAFCRDCGMLICIAPSKNGVQCKYDVDDKSNPTFVPHKCPSVKLKKAIQVKTKALMRKLFHHPSH